MGGVVYCNFIYWFIYFGAVDVQPYAVLQFYCSMHFQRRPQGQYYLIYLEVYSLVFGYIDRPSCASLSASMGLPIFLCSLFCNMLLANDSEVVYCRHEHTLLCLSIFLQVSSNNRCEQEPPVLKLRIINPGKTILVKITDTSKQKNLVHIFFALL